MALVVIAIAVVIVVVVVVVVVVVFVVLIVQSAHGHSPRDLEKRRFLREGNQGRWGVGGVEKNHIANGTATFGVLTKTRVISRNQLLEEKYF